MHLVDSVNPARVHMPNGVLLGSELRDWYQEFIACTIIVISKRNNRWWSFTWEEFLEGRRSLIDSERELFKGDDRSVLNDMVKKGVLTCQNGVFSITDDFIAKISQFICKRPSEQK